MKYTLKQVATLRSKSEDEALLTEIWYGRYFIRKFSLYLTWLSLALGLRANTVTLLSYVVGIVSAISFGMGGSWATLWGVILLHLAFVVDNVDGEVARVSNTGSLTGAYLDTLGHIIVNASVLFGLAYGQFASNGAAWIIPVGFVAAMCHIPISRYSIDHEILSRLRKAKMIGHASSEERKTPLTATPRQETVEKTFQIVQLLKKVGFPFNSTPFNILLITAVCCFDWMTEMGWIPAMPAPGITFLVVYFAVVLLLQQLGSLARNSRGRSVDVELKSLLDRGRWSP